MKQYDKGNKLLKKALTPTKGSRASITQQELDLFNLVIKESFPDAFKHNCSLKHDYCKYAGGNSSSADKDQSIAAMSRSMSIYFLLLSIGLLINCIIAWNIYTVVAVVISSIITILMWYRSFRFYKIRYIRIIRNYCYKQINHKN